MNAKKEGCRVLLVEDEILLVMMVEDMLREYCCESVVCASSADQAIKLIESESFTAALLDVNLHGRKSDDVADALAAKGIPFIFCTGSTAVDVPPRFQDRIFLQKPFGYEDLVKAFEKLLGGKWGCGPSPW